jgi:hypothetical protein
MKDNEKAKWEGKEEKVKQKKKNLSPCSVTKHHTMKTYGGVDA